MISDDDKEGYEKQSRAKNMLSKKRAGVKNSLRQGMNKSSNNISTKKDTAQKKQAERKVKDDLVKKVTGGKELKDLSDVQKNNVQRTLERRKKFVKDNIQRYKTILDKKKIK